MLRIIAALAAVLLLVGVLWDVFETIILPRRVSRRFRLARAYFRSTWNTWKTLALRVPAIEHREGALAIYGPLALLLLLALWVVLLIVAFALLLWGLGSPLSITGGEPGRFGTDLYFSGTTFLTLGLGDVIPHGGPARAIVIIEVGTGFGMLALVIGYLPVLYQAFSRREVRISLLDAHAGSPPTAGALLLRHPPARRARRLIRLLAEWEGWAAELLETHLSYPVLAYYRSQHEDQSWVAALTVILDVCAIVLTCGHGRGLAAADGGDDGEGGPTPVDEELMEQAAFTFAMARHAAVDLAQVFRSPITPSRSGIVAPLKALDGRLPPDDRARLRDLLAAIRMVPGAGVPGAADGVTLHQVVGRLDRLDTLRALYEPYLEGLAQRLLMEIPPWAPMPGALDDWQTTADGVTAPSVAALTERERPAYTAIPGHAD